jgi:hypothetical protein
MAAAGSGCTAGTAGSGAASAAGELVRARFWGRWGCRQRFRSWRLRGHRRGRGSRLSDIDFKRPHPGISGSIDPLQDNNLRCKPLTKNSTCCGSLSIHTSQRLPLCPDVEAPLLINFATPNSATGSPFAITSTTHFLQLPLIATAARLAPPTTTTCPDWKISFRSMQSPAPA